MLYKTDEVSSHLIDTSGFHVKAESERFSAVGSLCHENLEFENFRSSLVDYVKEMYLIACCTVQHDYFS